MKSLRVRLTLWFTLSFVALAGVFMFFTYRQLNLELRRDTLDGLVRERLYDSACLLLSSKEAGALGDYREPDSELSFRVFATQLAAHAGAAVKLSR